MTLKAIIIDDESKARENLKFIISDNFGNKVSVKDTSGTVDEGLSSIAKHQPDIVFLDILMKGETGFDLLEKVKDPTFDVIFTTAYDEYAIKALKLNAIDYLLKPIDIEELELAIQKVEDRKASKDIPSSDLVEVIKNLNTNKSLNKIAIPTTEGLLFVSINDIIRCESDENYTLFYLSNGTKKLVSKTIKFYEEILTTYNFFRTHRSHLVNLSYIKEYIRGDGGYLLLKDGSEVQVSRRKREEFLKLFAN